MSEPSNSEPTIKVNDRRRVHLDGEPSENTQESPPVDADGELDKLTFELATARRRIDELARAYQASEADREAFKQRLTREREALLDVERGNIAVGLLEAIDELDLCLSTPNDTSLAKGVRLIRESLLRRVQAMGVERVELDGRPYDPNLAEAADMELTTHEREDGHVVTTIRACYQLKGRVVRPGRVKVAKYMKPAHA